MRVVGLVLAAGASRRFGSDKLAASLDGHPLLDHVLDALRAVPLAEIFIVTRRERAIPGADDLCVVVNPVPEEGLSSSLRTGLAAIAELEGAPVDAILIALADQPSIDPANIRQLLAAARTSNRPVVVPAYDHDGSPNPVLLRRAAFTLGEEVTGDRGLGPVLAAHPDLVHSVPVRGTNPDVDTEADLARLRR
ncbi:MAG TPA: nucleotidyltransferase family protein [Candidatus Limnocylindrales bacterium]|nr:nucleotidyltransferase family protein [Candidatus Limnocylindrales bacterium]